MDAGGLASVPVVDLCEDSPASEDSRPPKRVRRMLAASVRFSPCCRPVSCPRLQVWSLGLVRSLSLGARQSGFAAASIAGSGTPSRRVPAACAGSALCSDFMLYAYCLSSCA